MKKITLPEKHTLQTLYFLISMLMERMAYYGIRGILVLYLINDFGLDRTEGLSIYGYIVTGIIIFSLIGAILGDFWLGNRRAYILGNIFMIIGLFILIWQNLNAVYIGVFIFILGEGLYRNNIKASYGKLYLTKQELLDSAFTWIYAIINIAGFIGSLLIGFFGETLGFQYGFLIAGILMIISLIALNALKSNHFNQENEDHSIEKAPIASNILDEDLVQPKPSILKHQSSIKIIITTFIIVFIIYFFNDFPNQYHYTFISNDENLSTHLFSLYANVPILIIGVIVAMIWTNYYSRTYTKLTIGLLFMVLSCISIYLLTLQYNPNILILSALLIGIAGIFFAPILDSVLTKKGNPKYLATMMSLAVLPIYLTNFIQSSAMTGWFNSNTGIYVALIAFVVMSIGLLYYINTQKNLP